MSYSDLTRYHRATQPMPTTTLIVDAAGGGDYTTLTVALAVVGAANPTRANPYRIYVRNGTYNEIQMDGINFVTIEGESREGVIIISDGLRADVDPVSGERYVDMDFSDKHGFRIGHTMTLCNLTMRVNDAKYCIHADEGGSWRLTVINCDFGHSNGYPIGIGQSAAQFIEFKDCIFRRIGTEGVAGIFWHNWDEQSSAVWLHATNCQFVNCGIAYLTELGSERQDLIALRNCTTDSETYGIKMGVLDNYWNGGGQGLPNVPYCIELLVQNCVFPTPIDFDPDDRPDQMAHVWIE